MPQTSMGQMASEIGDQSAKFNDVKKTLEAIEKKLNAL